MNGKKGLVLSAKKTTFEKLETQWERLVMVVSTNMEPRRFSWDKRNSFVEQMESYYDSASAPVYAVWQYIMSLDFTFWIIDQRDCIGFRF